ncbi:hypothetical protein FA15DRAFT_592657 [Coprinopsis marcescibilis]|uniref:Pyridoxamine 5'-phosphate oxidase Alr4036 family FMN-binding domain-containing protein n=1 Tax=Coprinopsis marcescibilis TaxID=230819 RepID=A0A5C3KWL0_COPMA|nr:hypothetical protein FA15DRAFT_592657 [Coprinopsis marcescibilis]
MASAAQHHLSPAASPRWKQLIESAISKFKDQVVIQMSTLDTSPTSPPNTSSPSPATTTPTKPPPQVRVRSLIIRSFLTLPTHPSTPLLLSSTDIRTPKVSQITTTPQIELAWWIDGTKQQFRITGRAVVVPSPTQTQAYRQFQLVSLPQKEKSGKGRGPGGGEASRFGVASVQVGEGGGKAEEGFDWEKKRVEVFKSMSSHMKATWCRPTPGTPLSAHGGPDAAKKWPVKIEEPTESSSEEDKRNWETALNNFALLVIEPSYVDFVDLGVVPNRRFEFVEVGEGKWEETELVA